MFNNLIDTIRSKLFKRREKPNFEEGATVGELVDNNNIWSSQIKVLMVFLGIVLICAWMLVYYVQGKVVVKEEIKKAENLKIELADKALDGEKMWRNHHEDELKKTSDDLKMRIEKAEQVAKESKDKLLADTRMEMETLREQLKAARAELSGASISLEEVAAREQERINSAPRHEEPNLDMQEWGEGVELDMAKSAKDYVPEGTYFTGYLMGGIVVSTALNTPDDNATPLTIRLKGRGNLAPQNETDISKCRIMGSAYGDLSSERAVIRLEKLICEKEGMYITSSIIGDVHGPDGFNGIKGEVIATSSKHIKNAMIGGVLSGLGKSVKGQDAVNITTGGLVSTPGKGFKDIAREGMLTGVSNAGEKIADYYLRQAEAMSPVLTIPGGVRVNAHITKGFFMGEIGTHRRVANERSKNDSINKISNKSKQAKRVQSYNQIREEGSDDNWK